MPASCNRPKARPAVTLTNCYTSPTSTTRALCMGLGEQRLAVVGTEHGRSVDNLDFGVEAVSYGVPRGTRLVFMGIP